MISFRQKRVVRSLFARVVHPSDSGRVLFLFLSTFNNVIHSIIHSCIRRPHTSTRASRFRSNVTGRRTLDSHGVSPPRVVVRADDDDENENDEDEDGPDDDDAIVARELADDARDAV